LLTILVSPAGRRAFEFHLSLDHPVLLSLPTRRSSDLGYRALFRFAIAFSVALVQHRIERPAGRIVGPSRRGRERPTIRPAGRSRSEEHTSELQSRGHLVCRLPLEKKKADISIDVDPVV